MTPAQTILKLKRENRTLRDRIEELERLAGLDLFIPSQKVKLYLTRKQAEILGLLVTHVNRAIPRDVIFNYLYGGLPDCDQPGTHGCIDAQIFNIRKVLKPHGALIELEYGQGWFLSHQSAERIRELAPQLEISHYRVKTRLNLEPEKRPHYQ